LALGVFPVPYLDTGDDGVLVTLALQVIGGLEGLGGCSRGIIPMWERRVAISVEEDCLVSAAGAAVASLTGFSLCFWFDSQIKGARRRIVVSQMRAHKLYVAAGRTCELCCSIWEGSQTSCGPVMNRILPTDKLRDCIRTSSQNLRGF
jgi:hypothetical protein